MPLRARTVHRVAGDVVAVEQHAPRVGRRQAHRHVERRRLARAVRPEQPDHFARSHLEADALDDRPSAVRLGERFGLEGGHSLLVRRHAARNGPGQRAQLVGRVDDDVIGRLEECQSAPCRFAAVRHDLHRRCPTIT